MYSEFFEAYAGNDWTGNPWVLSVYAGAALVALALLGAASSPKARVLVVAGALATWMAMGANAGFGQIARHLPVVRSLRYWEKLVAWPTLFLAMAAALGFERLLSDRRVARSFAAAVGAAGAAALVLCLAGAASREALASALSRGPDRLALASHFADNILDGLLAAGAVCALLALLALSTARGRVQGLAPALLAAIVVVDLAAANARAYVLLAPEVAEPRSVLGEHLRALPGLQRIVTPYVQTPSERPGLAPAEAMALGGAQALLPSWNLYWRVGNFEPYAAMVPLRASRFRTRTEGRPAPLAGLWGVAHAVVTPAAVALKEMAAPGSPAAFDPETRAALAPIPHRARAYLARDVASVDRRHAMEFALDPSSTASSRTVVEGPVPPGYAPPTGEARVVIDEPERVEVRTRSDRPALLVLDDAFADGWTAQVDGRPTEILPTNYLARGVWVDGGEHAVTFSYRTPMLREGWALFLAGGLSLAASAALRARRRAASPAA